MAFDFEKLVAYRKALEFVDAVYAATRAFPASETYGLVSQLRRAAVSVTANLAEGAGRDSIPDRRRFFTMARGSVFECVPLVEVARRQGMLPAESAGGLTEACEELSKIIHGLVRELDGRGR